MTPALEKSAERLKQWCIEKALPFWAETAQLPDGGWVEHLRRDRSPDFEAERRWRILARQIYVYSEATRLGWFQGEKTARDTLNRMQETGYVQRVTPDGYATERRRDLYDHAFYLLASSSLFRLTREAKFLRSANEILEALRLDFSHQSGGWRETPRGLLPRRQNPHMHLFEATLYLYVESGDFSHLKMADEIFGLFKTHFFDRQNEVVTEYFTDDWQKIVGEKGDISEPGHAMEWVWLLTQYQNITGKDTLSFAQRLYDRALMSRPVFLNDEECAAGDIRRETKRLWVQTEVIKAHLAMAERGEPGAADCAAALIDGLFGLYLNSDGTWNDQLNACGVNVAKTIPVSTFYHILCMATEAKRVSDLNT
ncbi:AGE family epimerase/isomerase [Litorimonas haliclonae]|uniref:AGE family epimerase/isomerase n=1 Tax=Litorimonas haliclonae TaxID=2081977 RepID=UPI0039EE52BA